MSKETHIESLLDRHTTIEAELKEAMNASSSDALRLSELKRRKLKLKDEIERLRMLH